MGSGHADSWQTNREQNGVEAFYLVNLFHDHLRDNPSIGFDAASGSFDGVDKIQVNTDDGANTEPVSRTPRTSTTRT